MKARELKSKTHHSTSKNFLSWLKLDGVMSMLAIIPILTTYLLNRYQLSIQEIWLPIILNLGTAAIISAVFYRTWKRDRLAAYIGAALTTITLTNNYDDRFAVVEPFMQAILPFPKTASPVYSLVFIIAIGLLALGVGRLISRLATRKKWDIKTLLSGLTITIGATFFLQLIPTTRGLVLAWPQFFYQPPKLKITANNISEKPDIYYIVMDRYASPEILKSQFAYDNSSFTQYLTDNQFYIRPDSHQNYPYTAQSIASTMTADYNRDMIQRFGKSSAQTVIPYNQAIRNSPVAQYVKSIGYKYSLIANWYETSNLSPLANHAYQTQGLLTVANHTYVIDNFAKVQLLQSVYWKFLQPGLAFGKYKLLDYQNAGGDQMTILQLKTLKNLANGSPGGRFIFAHILVPHDPYFFNADGSLNTNSDGNNFGEPIKQKYLNQVKFINGQMQSIVDLILQKSQGKAVIVMQSDEGPYPLDLNNENFDQDSIQGELASGNMLSWSNTDLALKYGNLAAYHIPGASQADLAAGGTNVNAFRVVLNTLFGANMNYLPDCYYAYPNGRAKPLYYQNINQRLTGQNNPLCANDGTGPKA